MRFVAAAWGILAVAVLDLLALGMFWALGWVSMPASAASLAERAALPATATILVLAILGALSVILTQRNVLADAWAAFCHECGSEPALGLDFCHRCGAA